MKKLLFLFISLLVITGCDICSKSTVESKATNLLFAIKEGNFKNYQKACGESILCRSEEKFENLIPRFSAVDSFTVKEVKERNDSISVYFNEEVEITSRFNGEEKTFDQYIGLHYAKEGCKLIQFDGGG